jgi:CheY-like chemotaxis protein
MKRVLIVEDDTSLCLSLADMLIEFGFEVGVAGDGLKALSILETADPLPDCILLDLHMPEMDGWQLMERLKQHEQYSKIKVVVMSGDEALHQLNADGHLPKPFELRSVFSILGEIKH